MIIHGTCASSMSVIRTATRSASARSLKKSDPQEEEFLMSQLLPAAMLRALLMAGPVMNGLARVWNYVNRQFTVGKITVSVTSFLIGLLILVLALLVSRTLSRVIERRIAEREYIDPGIRYTVARLIHYV